MCSGLMLGLAACETPTGGEEAEVQPVVQFQPEPDLTPRERLKKAISLLEVGQAGQARAELDAYLAEVPDSRLALDLQAQIAADPVAALGSQHFLYTMQPGDSISSVAKRMLGDPLKFYILARYNNLENPSEISVGQTIRVPGEAPPKAERQEVAKKPQAVADEPKQAVQSAETPAEPAQAAALAEPPKPETPAVPAKIETQESTAAAQRLRAVETEAQAIERVLSTAEDYRGRGEYRSAINHLEEGLVEFPEAPVVRQVAVATYLDHADQLYSGGRLTEAERALKRASELEPGNAAVGKRLDQVARRQRAEDLFAEASRFSNQNLPIDAFDTYTEVVKLVPDHAEAKKQLVSLKPKVAEAYHRQALTAYRLQELDKAVEIWDKVLREIDPNYEPAKVYRAQAKELMERLENLSQTSQ
ncbi:MAG: LysM domain-containing protein [Kiloniellales bacterium]|nr:LysM domain-containing protein [Kiloniellales bacterium]